jgi:hypothetical protein
VPQLTRLLRIVGAVLLIASASTFMMNRWQAGNDLLRYALLLGHTLVLAAAAYVCGLRVRESRGARTFLAMLLAVVPVNFTVLGGLVYSRFALDHSSAVLPRHALWIAPSDLSALVTVALTFCVLAPLTFVAHLALARPAARWLTPLYLGANAVLLVPVRDPNFVAGLFALVALTLVHFDLRLHKKLTSIDTLEYRIVRTLLFVPCVLLMGRAIYLYNPTELLTGAFLLASAFAAFRVGTERTDHRVLRVVLQLLSSGLAGVGWFLIAFYSRNLVSDGVLLPLFGLPFALMLVLMSLRADHSALYRLPAAAIAFLAVTANLVFARGAEATLLAIVTGIALIAYGAAARHRLELVLGVFAALTGVALHVALAIKEESFAHWGALSLLGIAVVFAAAYCEKYPQRLAAIFERRRSPSKVWPSA